MKSLSTFPILLLSILSCLSVAFSSPIPARPASDGLVQRSTERHEKRMIRAGALANVAKAAVKLKHSVPAIAAPKQHPAIAHPPAPKIQTSNFAHKVIEHSGLTSKHFNGVHPVTAHEGVVRGAYAGRTDLKSVKLIDPAHVGGKGDAHRGPDMRNHVGVQEHPHGGKPTAKQHLDVGHALTPIDTKHFAAVSSRPKPVRSHTI